MFKNLLKALVKRHGYRIVSEQTLRQLDYYQNLCGLSKRVMRGISNNSCPTLRNPREFYSFVVERGVQTQSQLFQDLAYLFFVGAPGKMDVFVEVGVGDGETHSNTLALEQFYGMHGVLVEADPRQERHITKKRTATYVGCAVGSGESTVEINLADTPELSWIGPTVPEDGLKRTSGGVSVVRVRTLDDILRSNLNRTDHLGFLSIDVEGHEMEVLNGFDIKLWKPDFVTIEHNHDDERKRRYREFFAGYCVVMEDLSDCDYWFLNQRFASATRS